MCREHIANVYDTDDIALYLSQKEAELQCQWNPIFTGEDLTEFSSATLAIENRLAVPALMHVIGATICYAAFCFGALGHIERNSRTLLSAILYICGGLIVLMGVLQFVCVVDDELAPRMKPNAAGEPSKFTFHYVRRAEVEKAMSVTPIEALKRGSLCGVYPPPPMGTKSKRLSITSTQIPPPPPPRIPSVKKSPSIIFVIENV
uniref:Uncharacterized protein n=1 Tax=Parascaris univalens TaxID=6257 RepID=A0A915AYL7_PARUN